MTVIFHNEVPINKTFIFVRDGVMPMIAKTAARPAIRGYINTPPVPEDIEATVTNFERACLRARNADMG